jgi:excisionase family DNA binding protein
MGDEKLLTVRDVSLILEMSEKQVVELAESGAIPAYKVGGVYLRFKKEQIQEFRKKHKPQSIHRDIKSQYSLQEKVKDFLYFNDFYILTGVLFILLLIVIFHGY